MRSGEFAVIDVETTCGDPLRGRVIEVGIVIFSDGMVREQWRSCVDPRVPLPSFVRMLTGIQDADLIGMPRFKDVLQRISDMTEERILVAHNMRFDLTVLQSEFARCGGTFLRDTLCTERLSRQLYPELQHHNLTSLCRHLGIPITGQHRALNDALATLGLVRKMQEEFGAERMFASIRHHWRPAKAS